MKAMRKLNRSTWAAVLGLLVVASIATALASAQDPPDDPTEGRFAGVAAFDTVLVRFGDEIDTIRLSGIRSLRGSCGARGGFDLLGHLTLPNGKPRIADVPTFGEPVARDGRGRRVTHIFAGVDPSLLLSLELVRAGWARADRDGEKRYRKQLVTAERRARREGHGAWRRCPAS